jgi:hypothetical protein
MRPIFGVLVCVLACFFVSCTGLPISSFADLFDNMADSRFKIENRAGEDLVLFRDNLSLETRIGGVPRNATYGMRERQEIEGLYILRAISFADYDRAMSSGSFANARLVDSTIVFVDMTPGRNTFTTNILTDKRGTGVVRFFNDTSNILEVYSGYWGQSLRAILAPGETLVQSMPPAAYFFYCSEVIPVETGGQVRSLRRNNILWDRPAAQVSSAISDITISRESGVENRFIYIYVKNSRAPGDAVTFEHHTTVFTSTLNHILINGGGEVSVYQIDSLPNVDHRTYGAGTLKFVGMGGWEAIVNPTASLRLDNGETYYFEVLPNGTVNTDAGPF